MLQPVQIANTILKLPEGHFDLGIRISTLKFGSIYETMVLGGPLDRTAVADNSLEEAIASHVFWILNHDSIAENSQLLPYSSPEAKEDAKGTND